MDGLFWQRLHGGITHLPIVLLPLSVISDFVGLRMRDDAARRAFHSAGMALALAGVLGGCAAVIAGLAMTHGNMLGSGQEKLHHLFVWPGFMISIVLVAGRLFLRRQLSPGSLRAYLVGMFIASALMLGAGYWGGEMLLHAAPENLGATSVLSQSDPSAVMRGHDLFLMNCAHSSFGRCKISVTSTSSAVATKRISKSLTHASQDSIRAIRWRQMFQPKSCNLNMSFSCDQLFAQRNRRT